MDGSHEELIAHFCGITGATSSTAQSALENTEWSLEDAVTLYFASQDEQHTSPQQDDLTDLTTSSTSPPPSAAPPLPSSAAPAASRPPQNRPTSTPSARMRTIHDLQNSHDGDGSDSEDEAPQDFFAGGEKSGLAVQDPNRGQRGGAAAGAPASGTPDYFNNLLNQARRNAARPEAEDSAPEAPQRSSAFTGRAHTLGGDDAPSQVIDDPDATSAQSSSNPTAPPRVERTLHLWVDGFSIDDGPLHRFDDPANAPVLALINQGRAPLALLDVQPGQEVDLQLDTHKDQNYVAPKRKYKPFGGSGQRLGSPTPAASSSSSQPAAAAATTTTTTTPPAAAAAAAAAAPSSSSPASAQPTVTVDESAPIVTLQIRLGDGTRLQSRFNTTHTIGDVYDFVNRANTASTSRSYALMTTFPSKELSDKSLVLGDMSEFKRGGVVVQKWT
ncbi:hypothetical protein AAFC00_003351 [Neodothiora populina]|uniref:SEP-domain-containing protein n=1 Tax=Neodothiora populina TaxID=2781224 RepID=A0ABR3PA85_9PEZI